MRKYITLGFLLAACHSRTAPSVTPEKHLVIKSRAGTTLYIDRMDNKLVMKTDETSAKSFCSYRIGWMDSSATVVAGNNQERERYFQYRIQQDWKGLANGDTVYPVFFQERPGIDRQLKEGVIVFEIRQGVQPDTLIYKDSYGNWGTQYFVLNRN